MVLKPSSGFLLPTEFKFPPSWVPEFFFFFFWLQSMGILVPQRGIKPTPLLVEAKSLNPWATRDVLYFPFFLKQFYLSVAVLGPLCVRGRSQLRQAGAAVRRGVGLLTVTASLVPERGL